MVESIALRLGLFLDDDEANIPEQENQHGERSSESEDYSFSDDSSRKGRIHEGNAKLLPLIKTSMRKTLDLQVNSGKLTEIMMDSLLIVTLFLDLQSRTLKDGMYRTLYQIIH